MSLETLKIVYHSTFNSVISYGLLFWGISPHSKKYFECKRELFESRWVVEGWRLVEMFKNLKILPLISQYIFSIAMFVIKHKHQFTLN